MRTPILSIVALFFLSLWNAPSRAEDVASVAGKSAALVVSPSIENHSKKTTRAEELARALSDHTLAFEEMYLKMYSSMSMENGKGKGKGKGGSSKGGMSKASKKSKGSKTSSKGTKGSKKSKKGKGKDDETMAPTVSAAPTGTPMPDPSKYYISCKIALWQLYCFEYS